MRPQTRPFMVEVKSRHPRGQSARPDLSRNPVQSPTFGDLSSRHEPATHPERPAGRPALAEANRLFAGLAGGAATKSASVGESSTGLANGRPSDADAQPRRVLPSLAAQNHVSANEPDPLPAERQRRATKRPAQSKGPVTAPEPAEAVLALEAEPEQVSNVEPASRTPEFAAPKPSPKLGRRRAARVPLGERWKLRRLPEVCW
jgi:hypothetical protein